MLALKILYASTLVNRVLNFIFSSLKFHIMNIIGHYYVDVERKEVIPMDKEL